MSLHEVLASKLSASRGRRIDLVESEAVSAALIWAPYSLLQIMIACPLAGARFTLNEGDDESGLGVEMRWLEPAGIIDEASNAYPGIAASFRHYFPVGDCLLGTGDPYFVQADDPALPLYRIPHTAVSSADSLLVGRLERVSPSLETFLSLARVR